MRMMMLVPDGVGVRNFVLGDFLRRLPEGDSAEVFHVIPNYLLSQIRAGINGHSAWSNLLDYRPKPLDAFLQGALAYAQMYRVGSVAMQRTLSLPITGDFRRQVIQRSKRGLGWLASGNTGTRLLEKCLHSVVASTAVTDEYEERMSEIDPAVLFCTQQRAFEVIPAVLAAKRRGIPTASFIFSWDNLSSKGRILAPFDHYLVWSERMREELRTYYPEVDDSRIHVVGTPQFDVYADRRLLWSRQEFFQRIGGDPRRPLICYSGGDPGTAPEDQEHVRVLLEQIRSGAIKGNPQVLLRPVFVDDGTRFDKVRREFPELIYSEPQWVHTRNGTWSHVIPLREDVELLANITHHSDLNVNLGSTMTLDFGIHDKPVVNIAFDVADPPIFGMPLFDFYYHYEHFQPVLELGASRVARSAGELAEHVNAYLANPALDREGRKRLAELQVSVPVGQAISRMHEVLHEISERREPAGKRSPAKRTRA